MKNKNEKENMIPIILLHQEKYQLSVTHESLIITTAQQNFKNYFVITDHRGINKFNCWLISFIDVHSNETVQRVELYLTDFLPVPV